MSPKGVMVTIRGGGELLLLVERSLYGSWTSHLHHDPSHDQRTPDAAGLAAVDEHPGGAGPTGPVILLMADRVPIFHIADTVGISRRFVYKWVQRFLQEGVAGLADKPGRGRRAEPGVAHVTANC